MAADARVVAVSQDGLHRFSKVSAGSLRLIAGLGVEGDAHAGATVQHLSRVRVDPTQTNLRQVHLIHAELFDELAAKGFMIRPGDLGENLTTRGIDLLALPTGTRLAIGTETVIEVTGLRNPCVQIEGFKAGLLEHVVGRKADGTIERKCGVMAVVVTGGAIVPGDAILVALPSPPHRPLERV